MKRVPAQASIAFSRKEKVAHRQWSERVQGKRVRRGPGRPKSKNAGVSHHGRAKLSPKSALHVTLKVRKHVPNLRTRRRFSVIKKTFVRFCSGSGFRLVRFSVMSNHLHLVVEADSKQALSQGMQKVLHSISRRLNALNVVEQGGRVSTKTGSYSELRGWLGSVFLDRYHAHLLKTPTEMQNAVRYVLQNAEHHQVRGEGVHDYTSSVESDVKLVEKPLGFLLLRACNEYLPARRKR